MTKMVTAPGSSEISKDSPVERRCENADCNVNKLVSMVPKRKTAQFVTEPCVIEKPMLVNGFTTIFQVDGSAAKISDLKKRVNGEPRTIYRIIPNTHAHIVNYVVVDTEGESLRKINSGEPATMKKLLESQRVSAEQMLSKLMTGQGSYLKVSNSSVSNGNTKQTTPRLPTLAKKPTTEAPQLSPINNTTTNVSVSLPTLPTTSASPISNALGALSRMPVTSTAKLPMRSVTIKKVGGGMAIPTTLPTLPTLPTSTTTVTTTVPSGLTSQIRFNSSIKVRPFQANKSMTSTSTTLTTTTTTAKKRISTPIIKTVPLSQLQEKPTTTTPTVAPTPAPVSLPVSVSLLKPPEERTPPTTTSGASTTTPADNSIFEKMQKELEDLRRTVALLAETQKKTLTAASTEDDGEVPPNKKAKN